MEFRMKLRAGTREDHERVDRLGEAFDLSSPEGYRAFLRGHAAALPGLEQGLDEAGVQDLLPDWTDRKRSAALLQDLAALGAAAPATVAVRRPETRAEVTGTLYVLEGSRLGGAYLRRRLAAAQPQAPSAYLGHGEGQPLWRSFVGWLGEQALSEAEEAEALESAREAFGAFEAGFLAARKAA